MKLKGEVIDVRLEDRRDILCGRALMGRGSTIADRSPWKNYPREQTQGRKLVKAFVEATLTIMRMVLAIGWGKGA